MTYTELKMQCFTRK